MNRGAGPLRAAFAAVDALLVALRVQRTPNLEALSDLLLLEVHFRPGAPLELYGQHLQMDGSDLQMQLARGIARHMTNCRFHRGADENAIAVALMERCEMEPAREAARARAAQEITGTYSVAGLHDVSDAEACAS